jgi:hypothetical protein
MPRVPCAALTGGDSQEGTGKKKHTEEIKERKEEGEV